MLHQIINVDADKRCVSQIILQRHPPVIDFRGVHPPENYGACFSEEFWRGGDLQNLCSVTMVTFQNQ